MQITDVFTPQVERPEIMRIDTWNAYQPWLGAGFTTRIGGYSQAPYQSFNLGLHVGDMTKDVLANRKKLTNIEGVPFDSLTCGQQTHGSNVRYVDSNDRGKGNSSDRTSIADTDGLYTDKPHIMLTSFYADCVPLFFLHPTKKIIGLAHAGWKGTVANIGGNLVHKWLTQFEIEPQDIQVVIGPAIGSCCYEVDGRIIKHFDTINEQAKQAIRSISHDWYRLDLKQINYHLLVQAGIPTANIEMTSWCTGCHSRYFYSHRQEKGKTGRMASYMVIREGAS